MKKIHWHGKPSLIRAIIKLTHESLVPILQSGYIQINANLTKAFKLQPKKLQPIVYLPEERDHYYQEVLHSSKIYAR